MNQPHEIARLKRLKEFVKKLGHRQVVQQSGISSAQLYRYMQGSPIPHERLVSLAQLGGVSTDWLLHGESHSIIQVNEIFEVTGHVIQTVLTTLQQVETGQVYRPNELKDLIPLFIINELNYRQYHPEWRLTEEVVANTLDVVRTLRKNRQLTPYLQHLLARYQKPDEHFKSIWAGPFCDYVNTANNSYFESRSGENYYARVAHNFKPVNVQWVQDLVQILEQQKFSRRLSLLDFGAGTCRYLRYLHRNHGDWFDLHGLERSSKVMNYVEDFERNGDLPKGTVRKEEWFHHSFANESMDVVTSYMGIHYFPYIPDSQELGLGRALFEMARTLKRGGIMQLVVRTDLKEIYLPYYSRAHQPHEIIALLKKFGLRMIIPKPIYAHVPSSIGHQVPIGFNKTITLFLQKI